MITRLVMTLVLFVVSTITHLAFNPVSTLVLGKVAGDQFRPSDAAYLRSSVIISAFNFVDIMIGGATFILLFFIWFAPIKRFIIKYADEAKKSGLVIALLVPTILAYYTYPAKAYYDTTNKAEAYTILPNWSAFWIPNVGNNKDDQLQFESTEYLNSKKVPTKLFIVPHAKFENSGGWAGWDAYVPTGRLIFVDRTTFSHEWVDASDRGGSKNKEGFPCQSNEGINITAGVSVGAKVDEKDAALFLYNFGVVAPKVTNMSDQQEIFRSVYYGRSLADVMQDVGRKKIQTLVCNEIGKRDFTAANKEMIAIMDSVEKKATEYFKGVGITLTFIGWADTFTFDHEIQASINSVYETTNRAENYRKLQPYAELLKTFAISDAIRAAGNKFSGNLPTTYVGELPAWAGTLIAPYSHLMDQPAAFPKAATTPTGK